MTDLNLLRNMLTYGEGFSAEQMALFESALNEITELRAKVLEFGGFSAADTVNLVTECGKTSQQLVHFERSPNSTSETTASMRIVLRHHKPITTLEQEVMLTYHRGAWFAQVTVSDFPECDSPAAALGKLSDWLMRLGLASQVGTELRETMEALWKRD